MTPHLSRECAPAWNTPVASLEIIQLTPSGARTQNPLLTMHLSLIKAGKTRPVHVTMEVNGTLGNTDLFSDVSDDLPLLGPPAGSPETWTGAASWAAGTWLLWMSTGTLVAQTVASACSVGDPG